MLPLSAKPQKRFPNPKSAKPQKRLRIPKSAKPKNMWQTKTAPKKVAETQTPRKSAIH